MTSSDPLTQIALDYEQILLVRTGEITLKGMNRHKFEQQIITNLKFRLRELGEFIITSSQSRIWINAKTSAGLKSLRDDPAFEQTVIERVKSVFGIVSVSSVRRFSGSIEAIEAQAKDYVQNLLKDQQPRRFKVESRRGDKSFPLDSPAISERVGGFLIESFPKLLTVSVKSPDFILFVEIREQNYLYSSVHKANRGLPSGTGGTGLLLLSGGIDSPVAGYMMASRGMKLEAIYFHAFPFTSDQAKQKVIDLAKIVAQYSGRIQLHIVNFTDIQITLRDECPADMMTIIMRRMMMRIADQFAQQKGIKALITGESLGQVASQTLEALVTTDIVATRPVFRPLIGMDKDDTTLIARKIGTFETSILPFEDCCTVFVAKHPKTHPSLNSALAAEQKLNLDELVQQGLASIEHLSIDAFV